MSVLSTETQRLSNLLKAEQWAELAYCRDNVVAYEAAAKTYAVGTALGRVITSGTGTVVAGTNTGNGAFGTVTVSAPAKIGVYRVVITAAATNAGTFLVVDPDGVAVGTGTVAVAFSKGGLAFTIADGATDFAVGDTWSITVAGTYKYKIAVETATDGSNAVKALVLEDKSVAATTDTKLSVLVKGPAVISKAGLVLDSTYDNATKKGVVYADLIKLGINILEAA